LRALTQDYNLPPPTRQAKSGGRRDRLRPHGRYLPSPQPRLSPTIARVNPQQLLALALDPSLILDAQGLAPDPGAGGLLVVAARR